eukprot:s15_g55.t1
MDFGAGRYWGDDGPGDDELDPWDPWPLEKLWRPQENGGVEGQRDDQEELELEELQDGEEVITRSGSNRHVMFDVASEASEASVSGSSTEAAPPAPPPSEAADAVPRRTALRLDASAVHRMVSSHIVRKSKESKESKESTDAGDLWANWAPGRAAHSEKPREPWHEQRPWGELWQEGQQGQNRQFHSRPSGSSRPAHIRPSKPGPGETRVRIGKELAESWTTREVLQASENHLEEFDVVHLVVALHRIAKSTDFQQLRHSAPLREQLAQLAKNAAEAVQPGPQGELPHVKEVSKAVWALAKVGPWSDSMEGYAPRAQSTDWGRGWSSVHRSLKVLGACAMERLHELDSHGLSNVAWSFAIARQGDGTARAVAQTALQILPDFKAQGLANTAWAMARLMADHEGRTEHRLLVANSAARGDHIAYEVARNAKDFTPQGLANIGWAFATLPRILGAWSCGAVVRHSMDGLGYDDVLQAPLLSLEDDLLAMAEKHQEALRATLQSHRRSMAKYMAQMDGRKESSSTISSCPGSPSDADEEQMLAELQEEDLVPKKSRSKKNFEKSSSCLDSPLAVAAPPQQPILSEALEVELPPSPQPEEEQTMEAEEKKATPMNSKKSSSRPKTDSEVIDNWAAAEMLQLTGEDKIMGKFDTLIGVCVLLNALAMAVTLECVGSVSAVSVGLKQDPFWCSATPVLEVLEHVFVVIFAAELMYRIYKIRWEYLRDPWNIMDAGLVLIAVLDLYILEPLFENTPTSNAVAFRVFRVIKLARVIRIVRALRLFRGLRVLVHACCSFLPSLSWSMALLSLCMLSGGLLMGNLLQDFINDESQELEQRLWIWEHYGTSYRAIYTMYEMTFAGNWPIYARPVIENVSHVYVLFYITYITFIVFAVIRVITAIFLRETLEAANNDAELMVQEGLRRKATYIHKLESIFNAVDESQDGLLSEDELNELFRDSRVMTYLETLDIDVQQSEALFHLLANGHGEITCADFIDGILRCKGPARAIDQILMQKDLRHLAERVRYLTEALEKEKVIPKRVTKKGKKHLRSRRSRIADELVFLGQTGVKRAAAYCHTEVQERHEGLMDAVAKELAEGVGNWSQQNLANILWAFAKVMVQPRPSRAIQAVAEDVLMTLNAWSALNMANLTWAFAKLSLRHPKLFAAIERECQQKLWNFSSQNLVNVAWSFAKVLVVRRSFFEELASCATQLAPDFNPQNCSNAVWAFAAVSHVHVELLEATARRAEALAAELVAQDLANLSWAFAKLFGGDCLPSAAKGEHVFTAALVHHCLFLRSNDGGGSRRRAMAMGSLAPSATAMVEAVLDTALQRVREFDAQGLTNLAQSLAKLDMVNDAMLTALLQEAAPKISGFSNQELAMLAWALARLQRFQGSALRCVAKETRQRLRDLTPQDVSVLVWSFARSGSNEENTAEDSGVRGKKDPNIGASMLKTLTETIMRLIPELTPQDLSTIIWGYATAGIECPDMIEAVADESVGKVANFAPQDMANVAWGLAKMGLLHEELFQVLSKDFVRRVQECQAQHLSIAAWSFAKLGAASPKLFAAIGQALALRAQQLDPQGAGGTGPEDWGGEDGEESFAYAGAMARAASRSRSRSRQRSQGRDDLEISVCLPSDRCATLSISSTSTVEVLKRQALQALGLGGSLKLLDQDGSVLQPGKSLEKAGLRSGTLTAVVEPIRLASTRRAFAAWRHGGGVVCWGTALTAAERRSMERLKNVRMVLGSDSSFTAILEDGEVVAWGNPNSRLTCNHQGMRTPLTVQQIRASDYAFAAVLADQSVITWGHHSFGGNSSSVQDQLSNVLDVVSSQRAFAATKTDGSVVTWGDPNSGGDSSKVQHQLRRVQKVVSSYDAFAAILLDGSVVTWGDERSGGNVQEIAASGYLVLTSFVVMAGLAYLLSYFFGFKESILLRLAGCRTKCAEEFVVLSVRVLLLLKRMLCKKLFKGLMSVGRSCFEVVLLVQQRRRDEDKSHF